MADNANNFGWGGAAVTADGGTVTGLGGSAAGVNAIVAGQSCVATGRNSDAGGEDTCAWAYRSCTRGQFTQAFGQGAFATGNFTVAARDNTIAMGQYSIASRDCQFAQSSSSIKGNGDTQTSVIHLFASGTYSALATCDLKMQGNASFNNYLEDGKTYSMRATCTIAATVAGVRKCCSIQCDALISYDFYTNATNVVSQTSTFLRGDAALNGYVLAFTDGGALHFSGVNAAVLLNASCRVEFEEVTFPDWTPLDLKGHGLTLWLKSDTGVTGSPVTEWLDQSGVSSPDSWTHTPNNMASANGPTVVADQVNGYPCLRFNGTDQYLEASASNVHRTLENVLASTLNGNSGYTVFVVAKVQAVSTNDDDVKLDVGILADSGEKFGLAVRSADLHSTTTLEGWNDDGTQVRVVKCNYQGGVGNSKFVVSYSSNILHAHMTAGAVGNQGVALSHLEQGGNPSSLAGLLQIGRSGNGSAYAQIDVFEIVICSRYLTQGEKQNVLGYLGDKYTLPL